MTAHARLSASGSHRWINCTASAAVEASLPETTSAFAEEGTRAHSVAYQCLLQGITANEWRKREILCLEEADAPEDFDDLPAGEAGYRQALFDRFDAAYPVEMMGYVQTFLDFVQYRINEARCRDHRLEVKLEQRLDFSRWVPEGFGTGDVVLVYAGMVEVIDLKYGKGVRVTAAENSQLRLYALGAYHELDPLFDVERLVMTIHQPRLSHVDMEELTAANLLQWADTVVAPAARVAYDGEHARFVPGEEQCRFCRAKATCRARAEQNLASIRFDFPDAELMVDEEIAELLPKIAQIRQWVDAVQDYALKRAERGHRFPGFKLVAGRSNRRVTDKALAGQRLIEAGCARERVYEPEALLPLTKLEEGLGKKVINELLEGLIDKPAGKPTLVPVEDKRPELEPRATAAEDFSDVDGADENE